MFGGDALNTVVCGFKQTWGTQPVVTVATLPGTATHTARVRKKAAIAHIPWLNLSCNRKTVEHEHAPKHEGRSVVPHCCHLRVRPALCGNLCRPPWHIAPCSKGAGAPHPPCPPYGVHPARLHLWQAARSGFCLGMAAGRVCHDKRPV